MKTVLEAQDGLTLAAALPRLMKKEADESEQMGEQAMLTYSSQRFGARGRHPPQRGGGRQVAASRSAAATVGGQGAYGARPEGDRGTNGLLKPEIQCYRCNKFGHYQDMCPSFPSSTTAGHESSSGNAMVVQRYNEGEGDVSGYAVTSRAEPEGEKKQVRLSSSRARQWGGENSGEKEDVLNYSSRAVLSLRGRRRKSGSAAAAQQQQLKRTAVKRREC